MPKKKDESPSPNPSEQPSPSQNQAPPPSGVDWGSVQGGNQEFLDLYPRVQWMHGKKAFEQLGESIAHIGGLFIPEDQFPNFNAPGWVEQEMTLGEGKKVKGWWSKTALVSVIRVKNFWKDNVSYSHFLCHIKGVEGLFNIQVKGVSKGAAMVQAFADHRKLIVQTANRNRPQGSNPIEPMGLWFVVVPGEHTIERSKADPSKTSEVTPPKLFVPKAIDDAYIARIYVGSDNYRNFVESYKSTEQWQNQIPKQAPRDDQEGQHTQGHNDMEYTGQPVQSQPAGYAPAPPANNDDDIPF